MVIILVFLRNYLFISRFANIMIDDNLSLLQLWLNLLIGFDFLRFLPSS